MPSTFAWLGICFCITQSAMFSGLNLAVFGISRLRLEAEAASARGEARKVLQLRKNSNFTLTTILWGNVAINVLLTLLSRSVLAGVSAFLFSTVVITFIGEIIPQAYFSRHAIRMASLLSPILRIYMFLLYPVVKPTSIILDLWLGPEGITYFRERDLQEVIKKHMQHGESEIGTVEGMGVLNFLALDDIPVAQAGEIVEPDSIIELSEEQTRETPQVLIGTLLSSYFDVMRHSQRKYFVLIDPAQIPQLVIDADAFVHVVSDPKKSNNLCRFVHKPVVITDPTKRLADILPELQIDSNRSDPAIPNNDLIILWGKQRRIITPGHILERLLAGIASLK